LREIYGAEIPQTLISKITDKILPEVNEWQNRALETVYPILKGLGEAINAVFSRTKQQLCIVHQIRNSTRFVPYKDRKSVCADLKKIYGAVNLDDAEYAKEEFREKWDKKYPSILRSRDANWAELTTFFEYPEQIRRLIYTTNAVEAYHRMVRKFTKAKAIFPTDDSIRKVVFLSVREITKKWRQPVRD
jgi:putative transposase